VSVEDLQQGDELVTLDSGKALRVKSLVLEAPQGTTHNLTVDKGHTFFVGNLGTWVHNVGPCNTCPGGACDGPVNAIGLGKNPVFFTTETAWTAPSKGTGFQYKVFQQEIDWSLEVKGVTNIERAQGGGAPYIVKDGVTQQLQLHHSRQNGHGPLFELSRKTHLETKITEGGRALHPYQNQKHPEYPVDRQLFGKDVRQYWMDRAEGLSK
jgi:hypothetical protein